MIERDLSIDTADCQLSGTLCVPDRADVFPVVLMLHGSGPQDRDENMPGQRLDIFNTIAHHLAKHGIGSLRYDKRGCGKSTGVYHTAGQTELVSDAIAWVDRLASEPFCERMFLLGHSEGCLIAPRVSLERMQLGGLILLCPTLTPLETVLMRQAQQIATELAELRGWKGVLLRGYTKLRGGVVESQRKLIARLKSSTSPTLRVGLRVIEAKSLRELMALDPRAIFEQVRVPMLVIAGGKDVQCDPADAPAIAALSHQAEAHVIPNLTHILRSDTGPAGMFAYGELMKKPFEPQVLTLIERWLLNQHIALK